MREYFLPTIRLTTWTCLIVGWKCWPFCTRTIIGRKQGYKMREYVLPENDEQKFGRKSVSILYHFFRTISSGIKKVAQKAQKNCFPLLRSGTKKYIICPNDDLLLWTSVRTYVRCWTENSNSPSGVERKCVHQLSSLAPRIPNLHPQAHTNSLCCEKRHSVWCHILSGYECEYLTYMFTY